MAELTIIAIHGVGNARPGTVSDALTTGIRALQPQPAWVAQSDIREFNWNRLVSHPERDGLLQSRPLHELSSAIDIAARIRSGKRGRGKVSATIRAHDYAITADERRLGLRLRQT